jgi:hypothetical protein
MTPPTEGHVHGQGRVHNLRTENGVWMFEIKDTPGNYICFAYGRVAEIAYYDRGVRESMWVNFDMELSTDYAMWVCPAPRDRHEGD